MDIGIYWCELNTKPSGSSTQLRKLHRVTDSTYHQNFWLNRNDWINVNLFAQTLVANSIPADRALNDAKQMGNVLREMEKLPKAERDVLLLSAIEELGTAEIAAVLKKSESAVRALLFRARTRLRERLTKGGKR